MKPKLPDPGFDKIGPTENVNLEEEDVVPWSQNTPPKVNIEPENDGLEDEISLFQGCILRFHVNLSGCTFCGGGFGCFLGRFL